MKKRVLVVDDEVGLTTTIKMNLESSGDYEVEVLNQSNEVIDKAREFRPDIILLDIVMPELDGAEVMNRLKADPDLQSIPVLVLTALVADESTTTDSVVDINGFVMLAKPVSRAQLIQCIEDRLAGKL